MDPESIVRLVNEHPGLNAIALSSYGLSPYDAPKLAELERAGRIVYVKDGDRSGWWPPGPQAAEAARLGDEHWWEAERAREWNERVIGRQRDIVRRWSHKKRRRTA